jgi:hypothetical protein
MTYKYLRLFLLALLGLGMGIEPATAQPVTANTDARQQTLDLTSFGVRGAAQLQGLDGKLTLNFGVRLDEAVTSAKLRLRYTYSPALLPELSHLKILLNQQVIATVPLPKTQGSGESVQDIEIDPRYFTDYNQMVIQLVGHYTLNCEDAMHSSLWASISGDSSLSLGLHKLNLSSDLLPLPAPFFDRRDSRRLVLPFMFGAKPSLETLNAAAVVSSWFGAQASYRSARFPVLLDAMPDRHAVVFATNEQRPQNLNLPMVKQPTISTMDDPADPTIKLLVLQGQDEQQLRMAADALVLGQVLLTGPSATVAAVKYDPARAAYDAPNWVRSDRATQFGELVDNPIDLQAVGHLPDSIRVNLRLPPDLMTWNRNGVPLDLKYRYTPLVEQDNSTLSVNINNSFVQAYRLHPSGRSGAASRLVVPLLESGQTLSQDTVVIPAFQIGSNNQLQFQFSMDYHKAGQCKDTATDSVHVAIDPDSSVDLSGFYHYTAMPNLALFANAGFPFTKYADLAQTVVVMPDQPTVEDMNQMLFVLGRMGRMTGVPALRVQLATDSTVASYKDRDLLILGGGRPQDLLNQWQKDLPIIVEQSRRSFTPQARLQQWAGDFMEGEKRKPASYAWNVAFDAQGPLAAVMGFESPLQHGRSAVALTASNPDAQKNLTEILDDEGLVRSINGDVTLVRGRDVGGYQVGEVYYVGHLSWWVKVWFMLSRHPLLLALMGIIGAMLLAFWFYSFFQRVAARRMSDS